MASNFQYLLLLLLFIAPSSSFAKHSFRPRALVIPVTKDATTLQYVTQIHQRTPLVPINLVLDLGGQFLWVDCEQKYNSSTFCPTQCDSAQCPLTDAHSCTTCDSPSPGCYNNTCSVIPDNNLTNIETFAFGTVSQDVVSVQSTNGFHPGQTVTVPQFIFSCAPTVSLKGLAKGVSGMTGLGRTKIAFPSQFASAFHFHRKFTICLTSYSKGVVFFGDSPYVFLPKVDAAQSLTHTPLILNPVSIASSYSAGQPSSEYFIGVQSIKVDDKVVPNIKKKLLSINKEGYGGTKISTVNPYTVLEASIFKEVTEAFIRSRNYTRAAPVAPFEVCFDSHKVLSTRLGLGVPTIELVLQNNVTWSIFGANLVVLVKENVLCLGVVDGGDSPRTSIVIGGYHLENNLLQFDLASRKLGFSSLLFGRMTTCANFNFTSAA